MKTKLSPKSRNLKLLLRQPWPAQSKTTGTSFEAALKQAAENKPTLQCAVGPVELSVQGGSATSQEQLATDSAEEINPSLSCNFQDGYLSHGDNKEHPAQDLTALPNAMWQRCCQVEKTENKMPLFHLKQMPSWSQQGRPAFTKGSKIGEGCLLVLRLIFAYRYFFLRPCLI